MSGLCRIPGHLYRWTLGMTTMELTCMDRRRWHGMLMDVARGDGEIYYRRYSISSISIDAWPSRLGEMDKRPRAAHY